MILHVHKLRVNVFQLACKYLINFYNTNQCITYCWQLRLLTFKVAVSPVHRRSALIMLTDKCIAAVEFIWLFCKHDGLCCWQMYNFLRTMPKTWPSYLSHSILTMLTHTPMIFHWQWEVWWSVSLCLFRTSGSQLTSNYWNEQYSIPTYYIILSTQYIPFIKDWLC